jgi:hypothetical protein
MDQQQKNDVQINKWRKAGRFIVKVLATAIRFLVVALVSTILWAARSIVRDVCRIVKRYRRRWRITRVSYRFYLIGQIVFLLGLALQLKMGVRFLPIAIQVCGAAMFFLGFVTWLFPVARKVANTFVGKWLSRILHGIFLIIARVVARMVVADAIKLPPQYFDLTVALVALVAYIPVWIGATALFLTIGFICVYPLWAIAKIVPFVANSLTLPMMGQSNGLKRMTRKWNMRTNKLYFHVLGILAALYVVFSLIEGWEFVAQHSLPGVRWFAYIADFQPAGNYPGVTCDGRIRLLDNGVVEIARIVKYDIEFHKESFKADADVSHSCIEPANSHALLK